MELLDPELAVLERPPSERQEAALRAAASLLTDVAFLRTLEPDELLEACRKHLRVDRLRAGEAICLQGQEVDAAYFVIEGTISCHVRKDLVSDDGSAHQQLLGDWKHRAEAKVAEEEARAKALEKARTKAQNAYLDASGGLIDDEEADEAADERSPPDSMSWAMLGPQRGCS